jgi:hypothetical protein
MLQENLDDDIYTFETYMLAGHGEVSYQNAFHKLISTWTISYKQPVTS